MIIENRYGKDILDYYSKYVDLFYIDVLSEILIKAGIGEEYSDDSFLQIKLFGRDGQSAFDSELVSYGTEKRLTSKLQANYSQSYFFCKTFSYTQTLSVDAKPSVSVGGKNDAASGKAKISPDYLGRIKNPMPIPYQKSLPKIFKKLQLIISGRRFLCHSIDLGSMGS
jgi:hypothetical protein